MYKFNSGHIIPIRTNADFNMIVSIKDNFKKLANDINTEIIIDNSINVNDQLFINVSHDIRAPLNTIYSAAQLIELYLKIDEENKNNTTEKIAANLNTIIQNSFRLMKVLNNILDLQKIKEGLFKLNYSYVNIIEVVEDVVQNVSEIIKDKQLNFIFDSDTEEEYIMLDVEVIERVILNLLYYATKLSNLNGIIRVYVSANYNSVDIEVTYEGIGIDKGFLEGKSNKKVDKVLFKEDKINGIGLKMAETLVEAHGGCINYFIKNNNNNTFIVNLTRKKNDTIYMLFSEKVINYDSLNDMIKIEFSDIDI